jgi:chromate transporter
VTTDNRLLELVFAFAPLSLFSFGGGQSLIAELQHQSVGIHHWITDAQFTDLYAISKATPGPATLVTALIGWQAAGFPGALVATLAMYGPSSVVGYFAIRWWFGRPPSAFTRAVERGLAPLAVGLAFAGVLTVIESSHPGALQLVTTAVAAGLLYATRVSLYGLIGTVTAVYLGIQAMPG